MGAWRFTQLVAKKESGHQGRGGTGRRTTGPNPRRSRLRQRICHETSLSVGILVTTNEIVTQRNKAGGMNIRQQQQETNATKKI